MKSKISFTVVLFSFFLVSCVPASLPIPTSMPSPAATLLSTPIPATLTHPSSAVAAQSNRPTSTPFVRENASADCFLSIDFIPGKTRMDEVLSAWGSPSGKLPLGEDFESVSFDFPGAPRADFNKQILETVRFYLKDCSLGKIIDRLGEPEKVEITVNISCIGGPTLFTQDFHYTSLGFSYFRFCDETQDCYVFHSNDSVEGKEFYSSDRIIEDSTGFNMATDVYDWHGFDVNVEEIENKIKDPPVETSTP